MIFARFRPLTTVCVYLTLVSTNFQSIQSAQRCADIQKLRVSGHVAGYSNAEVSQEAKMDSAKWTNEVFSCIKVIILLIKCHYSTIYGIFQQ